jgi:hypothetical protein
LIREGKQPMSFQIGEYVLHGELNNTKKNSTFGLLRLEGYDLPISLELTGDMGEDLRGKRIRFEAVPPPGTYEKLDLERIKGLSDRQCGPTGIMTADGWVRVFDCSFDEFYRRTKLGEQPPTRWVQRLYLEWWSKNGDVVLELGGAKIEYFEDDAWKPLPPPGGPTPEEIEQAQDGANLPPPAGLDITIVTHDGGVRRLQFPEGLDAQMPEIDPEAFEKADLQTRLDMQAEAVERAIRGEDPADPDCEDLELMDYCIEHDSGILMADLFAEPAVLPDADTLTDEQIQYVFKDLLRQLALLGVAYHMCEHYSARQAYKQLVEEILPEHPIQPALAASGWIQHFMSCESCPACEEEMRRECEEHERDRAANPEKYERMEREQEEEMERELREWREKYGDRESSWDLGDDEGLPF